MGQATETLNGLRAPTRELRMAAPAAWEGFAGLHDGAMADGALSRRVKELMALSLAVVKQCDGCIAAHAKAAAAHKATPAEVAESLSVALLMDGGPATVYGPRAWAAFQEFAADHVSEPVQSRPEPPAVMNEEADGGEALLSGFAKVPGSPGTPPRDG
jgi:AhpD family alkylhydroperoxidase